MKFYDRKEELRELRRVQKQAFEEHSRMTVLTGRRRIGKTSLGRMVMEGTPSVYFFVSRKDEALLCQDFMEQIRQTLGDVPTGLKTFKEVFRLLMIFGQNKKFTLFIDEFQEFWQINKSIFSDIQNLWDQYRRQTNIHLILSGSVYTMMEKIFKDSKEPLFGRADLEIRLKPFRTDVMKEIMRDANPEYTNDDLLALYGITGGVPKYIELFINNGCTNLDSMIGFMTRPDSQFIEEGRNLLIQEFGKNYGTYFSILSLIACGEMTQKDIQAKMEDGKNIGGQLRILEEDYKTTILLETMAGKGSEIGRSFEELESIIDKVEKKQQLGVCLDTCHVYDGGYDIVGNLDAVLAEFDEIIGLCRLKAVHLNDSMNPMGSHKDRHAKIGEGSIGVNAFAAIINHPYLRKLPFYLETPNELPGYQQEIELLKSLYVEDM